MGFKDSPYVIDAQIYDADPCDPYMPAQPSYNFQQSFISQILNLIAAIEGKESLKITATEAIKSLRVIDSCYQSRELISMPWLNESELNRAYQLNSQK